MSNGLVRVAEGRIERIGVFVFGHFTGDVRVFKEAADGIGHVLGRDLGLAIVLTDERVLDDVLELEFFNALQNFFFQFAL